MATESFTEGQSTITNVGPGPADLPIVGNANLKPPAGAENDGRIAGTPTTPASARSVVTGTSRGNSNKNIAHVCSFIDDMRKNIYLKKFIKASAQAVRDGIRAILQALGLADVGGAFTYITAKLRAAAQWLKTVQKYLKDIINFEKYVLAYITKIRAIIAWIRSLPARFLALLAVCLAKFLKLIKSVMTDFFKEVALGGETNDLINAAKEFANETLNTVKLATVAAAGAITIVGSATTGLLVPVSAAELKAADRTIKNYTASQPKPADIAPAEPKQKTSSP
jgi:hypothetical protein